jgi:GTPase SAR1 family protein
LIIEDSNVGKTSIIVRYTENKFEASGKSTLGVHVKFKFSSFDNIKIKFIDIGKFS